MPTHNQRMGGGGNQAPAFSVPPPQVIVLCDLSLLKLKPTCEEASCVGTQSHRLDGGLAAMYYQVVLAMTPQASHICASCHPRMI